MGLNGAVQYRRDIESRQELYVITNFKAYDCIFVMRC
jgi:hypothetical protein